MTTTQLAPTGPSPIEFKNGTKVVPVLDDKGNIQLLDMYDKDGRWLGSRRTVAMCKAHLMGK